MEDEAGDVTEVTGQRLVQEAIWNKVHRKRFYLAEKAPICQGRLRGDFGYMKTTPTAQSVLEDEYVYPSSFPEATKEELLEECALIRKSVPQDSVDTLVSRQISQEHWSKAKEDTSSSESELYFSHYKAGAKSALISHFHSLKVSIALR